MTVEAVYPTFHPTRRFSARYCAENLLVTAWCPRQDSNLRHRLRRAVLYPLSYGGDTRRD